jgi:hypothetical protein
VAAISNPALNTTGNANLNPSLTGASLSRAVIGTTIVGVKTYTVIQTLTKSVHSTHSVMDFWIKVFLGTREDHQLVNANMKNITITTVV